MDYQLTLPAMLRRAEQLFPRREIVTRLPDRSFHRYTYRDLVRRTPQLAVGLPDESLLPIFEGFEETAPFERVIVVGDEYEQLLAAAGADEYEEPELAETDAA